MSSPDRPEPYRVVARRFRPRAFEEVVGQDAVLQALRSALTSDRVPHALLFCGSRGVGKTTLARIFARALNCEVGLGPEPCGVCHACTSILAGTNPDVIEIDAASHNLVDDIRELRDRVGFASMGSRYKVYILDEVHMLTRNAFNAFLKTLEEPPARVVFILATTELHKVPETVRSRCQVHTFRRIGDSDIVTRLAAICAHEAVSVSDDVLREIAAASRGGMRDAETALERVLPIAASVAAAAGQPTTLDVETYRQLVHRVGLDRVVELVVALAAGDAAAGLHFAAAVAEAGVDEREALGEVVDVLRAVLLLAVDGPESQLVVFSGALRDRLAELAVGLDRDRIDAMIQAGLLGRDRIRRMDDRRLVLEITLLRMAEAGRVPSLVEILDRLGDGPQALGSGSPRAIQSAGSGVPSPASAASPSRAAGAPVAGGLKGALHAALGTRKPMLQSTVDACTFDGPDEAGIVRVRLVSPRRMHSDRLASVEVRELFRQTLSELAGRPIDLRVDDGESATGAPSTGTQSAGTQSTGSGPPSGERSTKPGAAAERIAKKFDGKFLDAEG